MKLILCECCDLLFYQIDGNTYDRSGDITEVYDSDILELDWDTVFFDYAQQNTIKVMFENGRIVDQKDQTPGTVEIVQFP